MHKNVWRYSSLTICLISISIIGITWYQEVNTYIPQLGQLVDEASVASYLENDTQGTDESADRVYIPTGIFIQSLGFVNAHDVNVTGYVWQKYSDDLPLDISRNFVLPEQVYSGSTVIEEAYRRNEEGYEVIGWYFDATLRQPFEYTKYPLDRHDIWIRIWHKDFDRNIVLVPDLSAYDTTAIGVPFGLDQEIVPGGWVIDETYFQYRDSTYDTDFGIQGYVGQRNFPELYFNIIVSRKFMSAFIVNIVPLLVISALLFSVLMTTTADEKKASIFGFDTSSAMTSSSALFFVAILAHIQLREQFTGSGVVYLETFYLMMYFLILLVSLNIYLFTLNPSKNRIALIYHEDNFFPKVAYWPILLGALAIITIGFF